ncbi:hypothetical protein T10_882 [Trichinella papuae]|uniref:Uncharacterized protein n=1 Tax=Trichinella papuae TaxID=268474 RepID=A0A0V1MW43_9BILA|nr:hypothetical protein T10_882 [Trichinella papuae]
MQNMLIKRLRYIFEREPPACDYRKAINAHTGHRSELARRRISTGRSISFLQFIVYISDFQWAEQAVSRLETQNLAGVDFVARSLSMGRDNRLRNQSKQQNDQRTDRTPVT